MTFVYLLSDSAVVTSRIREEGTQAASLTRPDELESASLARVGFCEDRSQVRRRRNRTTGDQDRANIPQSG